MILFPVVLIGGHLLGQAMAQVPELNFAPICREAAGEELGLKEDANTCMQDEAKARAELAKKWREFDAADRTGCVRLATTNHTASYVEVLTCLEMGRDARKLHRQGDLGISAPEPAPAPEREAQPARSAPAARHPAAVSLAPPEPQPAPGVLQVFCLPGLARILPACQASASDR